MAEQLAIDGQEMEQYLEKHYPEAMYYTATDENGNYTKTSLSFIVNVLSAMRELVSPLAAAWGAVPVSRRISLRQWALARKEGQARTLIVQWSGEFASMGTAWISAALRFLNSITTHSPMYGESATRRLFFVLDELPRIAREGDGLAELLDVGRSKGICLLAGVQNIEQLTKRWGEEVTDAVLGNCGTVIFGQLGNVGKSDVGAGRAAEMVGKVIWSEKDETTNPKTGRIKIRWRPQNPKLLVEANFFETLGPTSRGVVMALRKGTDLCMLTWPYDNWTTRRPAVVPAAWIKGWTKDVDTEEWAKRRKLARSVAMRELAGYEAAERAIAVCRRQARGRKLFATTAAGATSFAAGLGVVAALYLANPPAVNDWATVSVGAVLFDARTGQQMRQVITPGARVQLQVRTRSGGAWVVAVPNYGQVMIQSQFLRRALPLAMPWEGA